MKKYLVILFVALVTQSAHSAVVSVGSITKTIISTGTLQAGTTFFVSSGTVAGEFSATSMRISSITVGTVNVSSFTANSLTINNTTGNGLRVGNNILNVLTYGNGKVSIGTSTFSRTLLFVSTNANNIEAISQYPGDAWGLSSNGLGPLGYISSWAKPVGVSTGDYQGLVNAQFLGTDNQLHEYGELGLTVVTPGTVSDAVARFTVNLVGSGRSLFDGQSLLSVDPLSAGGSLVRWGQGDNAFGTSTEPANGGMYAWSTNSASGGFTLGAQPRSATVFVARAAAPVVVQVGQGGVAGLYTLSTNAGLVSGNTFTPTNRFKVTSNGEINEPTQPAFLSASVTLADVTGDGTSFTMPYTMEVYDQGSNLANSTFTAPVDGRYVFCYQIRSENLTIAHTTAESVLVTSNRSIFNTNVLTGIAQAARTEAPACTDVDMDANDIAYITYSVSGTGKTVDIAGNSTSNVRSCWSGYLAQ